MWTETSAGVLTLSGPAMAQLLRSVIATGRPFRFRAGGASMAPFIRDGDILTLEPRPFARMRVGNVVAFAKPGRGHLVVHRVIGVGEEWFRTRGDNAEQDDGLLRPDRLLGRVIRIERKMHCVRCGIGPEGALIAWLSAHGCLTPLMRILRSLTAPFRRHPCPG